MVYDPEIPVNIVSLGLVYQVDIDQARGHVDVDMTLTAPACGMGDVLVGDVERRLAEVPFVKSSQVRLVFDPPWARHMMSEEAQQIGRASCREGERVAESAGGRGTG